MIRWENDILGFVPKSDWLDIDFNVTRPNDPADQVFGDIKTANIIAEWNSIAAAYQIPVMAQFHGFDTEAQTTFRIPVDTHNVEKGLIKVKINQSERMRALLRSGVNGNEQMYDYVIQDGVRLADQVVTRTKAAKNELLATGQVTINENDLSLTVDYGVDNSQKNLTIDLDEDVTEQLQAVIDRALQAGVTITGAYTGREVVGKLRKNLSIQKAINGTYGTGAMVSYSALSNFLAEEDGINQLITNDLTYGASAVIGANGRPSITTKRYFPKDKITFFGTTAGGRLGVGLWGDAPEADVANLMDVGGSTVSPYVSISQWVENDPAVLWTKASALFIPVLYNPSSLWIATVQDGEGA